MGFVDKEVIGPHSQEKCSFESQFDMYCNHCGRFGHNECDIRSSNVDSLVLVVYCSCRVL